VCRLHIIFLSTSHDILQHLIAAPLVLTEESEEPLRKCGSQCPHRGDPQGSDNFGLRPTLQGRIECQFGVVPRSFEHVQHGKKAWRRVGVTSVISRWQSLWGRFQNCSNRRKMPSCRKAHLFSSGCGPTTNRRARKGGRNLEALSTRQYCVVQRCMPPY
jgi:hypothetical protein